MSLASTLEALESEARELARMAKASGDVRSAVLILRERRELAVLMHPEGAGDDENPEDVEAKAIEWLKTRGVEVRRRGGK